MKFPKIAYYLLMLFLFVWASIKEIKITFLLMKLNNIGAHSDIINLIKLLDIQIGIVLCIAAFQFLKKEVWEPWGWVEE